MNDDDIRSILAPLRDVEPPAPRLDRRPAAPPDRPAPFALAAAAALLLSLAAILLVRPAPSPNPLAAKLSAVEAKIAAIEHEELRALLRREVELLREELRLSGRP